LEGLPELGKRLNKLFSHTVTQLWKKYYLCNPFIKTLTKNMIIVQIKEGENLEKSLKAFKKKFDRIGIVKELRVRKVYNKPSVVRRQKKLKAVLRQRYIDSLE
jgi:small subunit ribosomal protein S21